MEVILPRRKKFVPKYEVEGVSKITISEETQANIELYVGPDVNSQHPWKEVKKATIIENIESNDASEFFHLKEQLMTYKEEEILIGYIVDESKDYDEFYVCYTKGARDHCKQQSEKFHRRQQKKLEKAVLKKPRKWVSLGSEAEIQKLLPINTRPLIEVEVKTRFPSAYQPERFVAGDTNTVRDVYLELTKYRNKYTNVFCNRADTATQVAPSTASSEAQTELRYQQNVWTQSVADSLEAVGEDTNAAAAGAGSTGVERESDKSEEE